VTPGSTRGFRRRRLGPLAVFLFLTPVLGAQNPALPVYGGGFAPGLELAASVVFMGEESRMGDGTALGATGTLAIGRLGVAASAARFDVAGNGGRFGAGVQAGVKVVGGDFSPLAVFALGGIGTIEDDDDASSTQFVPLGMGFTLTLPTPLLSIKPWLAPRLDMTRTSFQGESDWNSLFGLSAGVDLTLLSGFAFRAAYDYLKNYDPIVAFGAAMRF